MTVPALHWPLRLGTDGRFALSGSIEEAWGRRIVAIISTRTGERAMRADYGCGLADRIFDTDTNLAAGQSIRQALATWAPSIDVIDVRVARQGLETVISVDYRLPGGDVASATTAFQTPIGGSQ